MDDGRIGDGMTLSAIAKQLDEVSSQLDGMNSRMDGMNSRLEGMDSRLEGMGSRLDGMGSQVGSVQSDVKSLDSKFESLDRKMTVEFEETRRVVKLGFESVEMLDEKIDRRLDDADRAHADHKSLLETAIVRLRKDIKAPSRGPRRR